MQLASVGRRSARSVSYRDNWQLEQSTWTSSPFRTAIHFVEYAGSDRSPDASLRSSERSTQRLWQQRKISNSDRVGAAGNSIENFQELDLLLETRGHVVMKRQFENGCQMSQANRNMPVIGAASMAGVGQSYGQLRQFAGELHQKSYSPSASERTLRMSAA